jgi:outer membrane protein assembly factor BamB
MGNTGKTDIVYCLDARDGSVIWKHSYPCGPGGFKGPRATPVNNGDGVYTFSRKGLALCLDADSGKVRWQTDVAKKTGNAKLRWGYASSPVFDGNLLFLNIGEASVALNKDTGKIVWKSKKGNAGYASIVLFNWQGKRCLAIFSGKEFVVAEARTGRRLWSRKWETKYAVNAADPLIAGKKIFVSSGYDYGCALFDFSGRTPKQIWRNKGLKNHFSSSVYVDEHIYGVDGNSKKHGFLRCIDIKDGTEKWSMPIGFGSLIAVDNKLVVLDEKGTLHIAEVTPEKYKELSKAATGLSKLCWTSPVFSNGIVYCRNDKGTLTAIDVR